ncbi:MAG: CocE/NonD family hydrolase [Actinobacteria bacterium]|nr:CocE/NonD family hydrolase [Actinomycetota bacterium]
MKSITSRSTISAVVFLIGVTACSSGNDESATETADTSAPPTSVELEPVDFSVVPGTHQITVTGAEPGLELSIESVDGAAVAEGTVDELGSFLQRDVEAGDYRVVLADRSAASDIVTVYDASYVPDQSFYDDQTIESGFGYITVRDGTTLSATVWLPGEPDAGPYPTVVEYSGYAPSDPGASTFAELFNTLGYAYVGVNMRGTGCSGGSYLFFEESQLLDGYDVIEAVAAQSWVANNKVGMVGISYPGISQLFVASTQPPSLAAITPLSVIDDSYRGTLYPGGILNTGFAVEWTEARMEESKPFGQSWAKERSDEGDETCASNQNLRLQNPDLVAEIDANPFYSPEVGDEINPSLLVDKIEVPVFLAGAWQDEQTGGHFPALLENFDSAPHLYVTLLNGLHTESISTAVFPRYAEFLSLYVARAVPDLTAASLIAPILSSSITGSAVGLPQQDRFTGMTFDEALAMFESEPKVRVLFEEGAADGQPAGSPLARWQAEFSAWPIPQTELVRLNLGANGTLSTNGSSGSTRYVADPTATPGTYFDGSGSDIWRADVAWNWVRNPAGTAAEFTSEPLVEDLVIVGPGSADLWISSDATDTDLEVMISEIRPDGTETFVQSGWLRASHRALDEGVSTKSRPSHTHLEADAAPLTPGEITLVRVEIFPVAHPFRAGSRIRVTIDAPGGNHGEWEFRTISAGENVTIHHDAEHPSSIVFSTITGLNVPRGVAPCGALRGQPCRSL